MLHFFFFSWHPQVEALTLLPQKVTLSRDGTFTETIKLKWGYVGEPWPTVAGAFVKTEVWTQRGHGWGKWCKDTRRRCPPASWGAVFPHSPWEEQTLPTPWPWPSGLQNRERTHSCCWSPSLRDIVTAALGADTMSLWPMIWELHKPYFWPCSLRAHFNKNPAQSV